MKHLRTRVAGALLAATAVAGGFLYGTPGATAQDITTTATVNYLCSGATNDVATTDIFGGNPQTSTQFLAGLTGTIPGFAYPIPVQATGTTTRPISVVEGSGAFPATVVLGATLPQSLIDGLRNFGLSQLVVQNGSFNVNVTNGTPAALNASFATYPTIPLTTSPIVVSQTLSGNITPTVGAGGLVQFRPGTVRLSLVANIQILFTLVKTITVNCTENPNLPAILLGQTSVTASSTTTTGGPTTTTTTAPTTTTTSTTTTTQPPTTTTTSTTTTTTTTTSTTTAPTTTTTSTTTTTQPPTTTTSTTTTTVPQPTGDAVDVRVTGAINYANRGAVGGAGYAVLTDFAGVSRITGFGTLAGTTGGSASVAADIGRFLFWNFGTVTISDPAIGQVNSLTLFGPITPKVNGSTTVTGGGLVAPNGQLGFVNVTATFTDAN